MFCFFVSRFTLETFVFEVDSKIDDSDRFVVTRSPPGSLQHGGRVKRLHIISSALTIFEVLKIISIAIIVVVVTTVIISDDTLLHTQLRLDLQKTFQIEITIYPHFDICYLIPFPQETHYWLSVPAAFNSDQVPLVLHKEIDRKMTRILSSHLGL